MRANHDRSQLLASEYQTITVRLNGSSDLQLSINIRELRVALGHPSYNLMAKGVFNSFASSPMLDDDVEDVDHMSD